MAASAAFATHDNRLLLILRDDDPEIKNPNVWCNPGGCVEEGETFDETIQREFEEELGIIPANAKFIGFLTTVSHGIKSGIYSVRLDNQEVAALKLGDEGQRFDFFTYEELQKINLAPSLKMLVNKYSEGIKALIEGKRDIMPEELGLYL